MTLTSSDESTIGESPTIPQPYVERDFRFEGVLEKSGFLAKFYSIRAGPSPIDQGTLDAARAFALLHLIASADAEGDHYRLGFAILHVGKDAVWLLLDWWAHGDILCQTLAVSKDGEPFAITERPFHACVWEGVVITHEHRAWIDCMLTERPDPDGYIRTTLADGRY